VASSAACPIATLKDAATIERMCLVVAVPQLDAERASRRNVVKVEISHPTRQSENIQMGVVRGHENKVGTLVLLVKVATKQRANY
jgi:hypothetical protein